MIAFRTLAQLVRLPNLPTAIADIALAALATDSLPLQWFAFLLLAIASCSLYMAGMVWNDYFDADRDRKERPERPIPSGRISRKVAGRIGATLVALGLVFACLAGAARVDDEGNRDTLRPLSMAICLSVAIFAYDGWLKKTAMGPVAMGSCRFFNVLMGITLSGGWAWPLGPALALAVGTYIAGVTWFARTEAVRSNQRALAGAAIVMAGGITLLGVMPNYAGTYGEVRFKPDIFWLVLLAAMFVPLARGGGNAVLYPDPQHVQRVVKASIRSLILFDAAIAVGVYGPQWGIAIVALVVPMLLLGRWVYST